MLAQALVGNPAVIIADEPTTGQDAITRAEVVDELATVVSHGVAVVLLTHDLATAPSSPPRLARRTVSGGTTAQLFRVYVRPEHRRQRLARALVNLATQFVADTPEYEQLYLHTDTRIAGAEPFWRSMATEVYDARDGNPRHKSVRRVP